MTDFFNRIDPKRIFKWSQRIALRGKAVTTVRQRLLKPKLYLIVSNADNFWANIRTFNRLISNYKTHFSHI